MAFQPVPGCRQVVLNWTYDDVPFKNVLHFDIDQGGDVTSAEADTWDSAITTAVTGSTAWFDNLNAVTKLNTITVRSLHAEGSPAFERTINGVGTNTADTLLPGNVAICTTLRTAFAGRSGRGRVYHGGLTSAVLSSGSPNEVGTTQRLEATNWIVNIRDNVQLSFGLAQDPLVVVSRYHNKVKRTEGVMFQVTSIETNARVDTQRRRLD